MDDYAHRRYVQERLKKKFGSHKCLYCKMPLHYPQAAEREFKRATNAYLKLLKSSLKVFLPEIKNAAKEAEASTRHDAIDGDFLSHISAIFAKIADKLNKSIDKAKLEKEISRAAFAARRMSVSEWRRAVKRTLGVDLSQDYYMKGFYDELMTEWVNTNVGLISTIPQESLGRMREIVLESYAAGKTTRSILEEIQDEYDTTKAHARFIARDQMAKLNAAITQKQQADAGVRRYKWSTSADSRVRESHAELDGRIFDWDDPPIVDPATGRRCHPGEDFQCRCVALPVFDFENIDLPIKDEEE